METDDNEREHALKETDVYMCIILYAVNSVRRINECFPSKWIEIHCSRTIVPFQNAISFVFCIASVIKPTADYLSHSQVGHVYLFRVESDINLCNNIFKIKNVVFQKFGFDLKINLLALVLVKLLNNFEHWVDRR